MCDIHERIQRVRDSISEAEISAGRNLGSVRLVAVSKFHPAESVIEATSCGQFLFGENRVQEAVAKFEQVRKVVPSVELHMIGSLQRNKVKSAVTCASCIQSVDRLELLEEIEKHAARMEKRIQVLFEFHTGEDTKSGYSDTDDLLRSVEFAAEALHIVPCGFMTMAPFTQNEKMIIDSFRKLTSVQGLVRSRFPELELTELSMGMSNDYRIAISEGATMVRIGTAIFGSRA